MNVKFLILRFKTCFHCTWPLWYFTCFDAWMHQPHEAARLWDGSFYSLFFDSKITENKFVRKLGERLLESWNNLIGYLVIFLKLWILCLLEFCFREHGWDLWSYCLRASQNVKVAVTLKPPWLQNSEWNFMWFFACTVQELLVDKDGFLKWELSCLFQVSITRAVDPPK